MLALDGEAIESANDLVARLARRDPGDDVELHVLRDGDERTVTVELGEFEPPESTSVSLSDEPDVEELLGIRVIPITAELASRFGHEAGSGTIISAVRRYSDAARAGVRAGLLVVEVNGEPVPTVREFERVVATLEDKDVVSCG